MRLIDADAFILEQLRRARVSDTDWQKGYWLGVDDTIGDIGDAPTIEAEPVRHGRVIVHEGFEDEYYEYCSECKSRDVYIGDNYCPNCGAKMDLED